MACKNNETLLHAYFDGELDVVRSLEFELHVESCPDCARDLRDQQTLRQSLRSTGLYERAPESFKTRLRPVPISTRRRPILEWLAVAAALVIAIFMGARVFPNRNAEQRLLSREIVASHIRSLQPGHLFDVESTDQHTVKPWFDGKLDFAPPVKDLANQGFPLIGGRLDYVNGRAVAALVYRRQKHLINVFIWPAETKPARIPNAQTIQGYNLIFWWSDGIAFCAASDLNNSELRQFTQILE